MDEIAERHPAGSADLLVAAFGSATDLAAWTGLDGHIMLASAGEDRTIRRWDATTGTPIGEPIRGYTRSVHALIAWTDPGGHTMLASAGEDRTIRRWDATTGTPIGEPLTGHTDWIRALTVWTGADGHTMLASGGDDGTIRRWDATTGTPVGEPLTGHTDWIRALTVWTGADGHTMLASGGDDGTIRRWDATTGAAIGKPITCHWLRPERFGDHVRALVAWNGPSGPMLASCHMNGTIRRWNTTTGASIGKALASRTWLRMTLTAWEGADGPRLASYDMDGMIRRWDATTGTPIGKPLRSHAGGSGALTAWTGADGGTMLASSSDDGAIWRWDATTGMGIGDPLTGHTRPVDKLVGWTSPDGYPLLASAGRNDSAIRRWNGAAGTQVGDPLVADYPVAAFTTWTAIDGRTMLGAVGYDEIIRWDATAGTRIGPPVARRHRRFRRYPGLPNVLIAYTGLDGRNLLACGDSRGEIERWDATTGTPIGNVLTIRRWFRRRGYGDGVVALTAWTGPEGPLLASGHADGTLRFWDATSGALVAKLPSPGYHYRSLQSLTAWNAPHGAVVASGRLDGTIQRTDVPDGTLIGNPLTGHSGAVRVLTSWIGSTGPVLASGGDDGMIRRWDAIAGTEIGEPLSHSGGVAALAAWASSDGPMLASGGDDGTIRVWNATTGTLLQRVLVEPIRLRGLADRPATRDLLGRGALTQALSNLLLWRPAAPGGETGPSVVSFEGPWGTGKTTVMRLVESRIAAKPESKRTEGALSVVAALRILRHTEALDTSAPATLTKEYRGALTSWFNPWVYQSREQVWAGLARSITDAAKPILFPDEAEAQAESYWLGRNAQRIDRFAVSRSVILRSVSPLLGLGAVTALATILVNFAKLNSNTLVEIAGWRVTPSALALVIAATLLVIGILHTARRYRGPVSRFLPPDLVRGPVLSGSLSDGASEVGNSVRDPVYRARSGYLKLVQDDTAQTIRDLRHEGYDLVVFIDDLDRCTAATTAEVFEAINLFLSGTSDLEAKFVIGLDPAVVAAHLETVYRDLDDEQLLQYGDDPSAGWAFLRKVVQLPVGAPRVSDSAIDQFLAAALDVPVETVHTAAGANGVGASTSHDNVHSVSQQHFSTQSGDLPDVAAIMSGNGRSRTGSLERQPEILALIKERLAKQPERSAREAKRILNVWQLYQRVLDLEAPLIDDEEVVKRACQLVILAEIVTRWPALQLSLHQTREGRRGLQILAGACHSDAEWKNALALTGLDTQKHARSVVNLRDLLRTYDGASVADLAARVL